MCCGGGAARVVAGGLPVGVLCVDWLDVCVAVLLELLLCAFLLLVCAACLLLASGAAALGVAGLCAALRLRCVVLCPGWVRGWLVRLSLYCLLCLPPAWPPLWVLQLYYGTRVVIWRDS